MDTEQKNQTRITNFVIPVKKIETHPEGEYEAVIKEVWLEPNRETRFGVQDTIHICFETEEGRILSLYPAKITTKNKTGKLLQSLGLPINRPVKSSDVIEKKCRILVKHRETLNGIVAFVFTTFPI